MSIQELIAVPLWDAVMVGLKFTFIIGGIALPIAGLVYAMVRIFSDAME